MPATSVRWTLFGLCLFAHTALGHGSVHSPPELTEAQAAEAARQYQQYCALCHGADREGHANDHAPSLRSRSLLESIMPVRMMATAYGRPGTPMAGFLDDVGGPLSLEEIRRLTQWLNVTAGVPVPPTAMPVPVTGDTALGERLYQRECSSCHGADGSGGTGTALGNQAMLSMTTDHFLRKAIADGRDGTPMPAFAGRLSDEEIDGLTAFLRSRATGWEVRKPVLHRPPDVDDYVLNPDGEAPEFELDADRYVRAADLHRAMQDGRRMVILDTRLLGLWQLSHIEGSVPLPYYYDWDQFADVADDLPVDGTWIVTYCECPRAAAEQVNAQLTELGFENTAVLWEGAFGWVSLGYPVARGDTTIAERRSMDHVRTAESSH